MDELNCFHCGSKDYIKSSYNYSVEGIRTRVFKCNSCGRRFSSKYHKLPARSAEKNCPKCDSSNTVLVGNPVDEGGERLAQIAQCKDCSRSFRLNYCEKPLRSKAKPAGKNCPKCGGSNTFTEGLPKQRNFGVVQRCRCKDCKKRWSDGASRQYKAAEPADVACEHCGSSDTVKNGCPVKRRNALTQSCRCKACNKIFTPGRRKKKEIILQGKVIHTYWEPPGLKFVRNVNCPNCKLQKIALKSRYEDTNECRIVQVMLCLSCGQEFRTEKGIWNPEVLSRMGKDIPLRTWDFNDDIWDLRKLYPHIQEFYSGTIHLHFEECGDTWFKQLVKSFLLNDINSGLSHRTVVGRLSNLGHFGRFLVNSDLTSFEKLDRKLMSIYWVQERAELGASTLTANMTDLKLFFQWVYEKRDFIISTNLISSYDYPKRNQSEPDPLEDFVLNQIRDNLHILPEPLQLMFMLGFWLGARPRELCFIQKKCLSIDPDGTTWWLEFQRQKSNDEHRLPITTELVKLIQQQQAYITKLYGEDYPYLFCHYQNIGKTGYSDYPQMKPMKKPPIPNSSDNPMVKAIRQLIEQSDIRDSNGRLAKFMGKILRPSRATHLIENKFSLDFVRIWLKHRSATTTKRHYTRYPPGQLLDVASVMANLDVRFYPYDSNPESLRQNPELHELDGLTMLNGEPLYGYCVVRDDCLKFGHCYGCGFHIASADKLPLYKEQLEKLKVKEQWVFSHGSTEMLNGYQKIISDLEGKIDALEKAIREQND